MSDSPDDGPPSDRATAGDVAPAEEGLLQAAGERLAPPGEVTARVKTTVRARWQAEVRARRVRRRAAWLGLAAAAALVLVVVSRRPGSGPLPAPRVPAPAVVARLEVSIGSGAEVLGPGATRAALDAVGAAVLDGSTVATGASGRVGLRTAAGASLRLASETRLRLNGTGLALEQGTVYVDNPPSARKAAPLAVRTPLGTVRDRGTQFEVGLVRNVLVVRVREGEVELTRPARADTASAGTELRLQAGGELTRRAIARHGAEWAWTVGLGAPVEIEGRPLREFLVWVSREMGWRLSYQPGGLEEASSRIVLHGDVAGLTPEEALTSVLATCNLSHRLRGDALVVEDVGGR